MSEDNIIQLQQEVNELEEKHKASLDDPTKTIEERQAITNEYMAKYKKLEALALSKVTEYKDFD